MIGFIAHLDTSPAVSGENVNPIIHKNYQGGDIVLPKDPTQIITVEKSPVLKTLIGDDIITADGTADLPGLADAEPLHRRHKLSRQTGIQLAARAGEDDRDFDQPGADFRRKEAVTF